MALSKTILCSSLLHLQLRLSENGSGKQTKFKKREGCQAHIGRSWGMGFPGSKVQKGRLVCNSWVISKGSMNIYNKNVKGFKGNIVVVRVLFVSVLYL